MKFTPYSYSKIHCFQTCPRKFEYCYVQKIKSDKDNLALVKGSNIHTCLETGNYEGEYKDILLSFANSKIGQDILSKESVKEYQIKLDSNFEPASKDANDHLFVGYIDRVNKSDVIEIIDFKTGKYKEPQYQSYLQLIYYSLYIIKKYNLEKVKIRYVYVEHNKENSMFITKKDIPLYTESLKKAIQEMEDCNYYYKNQQILCDYCEFRSLCDKDLK